MRHRLTTDDMQGTGITTMEEQATMKLPTTTTSSSSSSMGIQMPCYTVVFLLLTVVIPCQVAWSFFSVHQLGSSDNELPSSATVHSSHSGDYLVHEDSNFIERLSKVYTPWSSSGDDDDDDDEGLFSWCPRPVETNTAVLSSGSSTRTGSFRSHPNAPHAGLLYVKNHKAASSTGAGVTLRIAHNVAQRKFSATTASDDDDDDDDDSETSSASSILLRCPNEFRHGYSIRNRHAVRDPTHSFLWTTVRQPAATALSAFFFFSVSRSGRAATTEHILAALRHHKSRQVDLLATNDAETGAPRPEISSSSSSNATTTTPQEIVDWMDRYVMSQYNFMAVVERMPESLVVLKYLLGIEWHDLVVLPAKQSGTWFVGGGSGNSSAAAAAAASASASATDRKTGPRCVPLIKPFTTPQVDEYLAHDFVEGNWDYYLYAAANRSLDRTIDALGRSRVQEGVQILQQLQHIAQAECLPQATFPCSPNGTVQLEAAAQSCYAEDCGCAHACVDQVLLSSSSSFSNY
jgi:hypothetical protein